MLRAGDEIDRYTVGEVIGEGGMGCVYRAHDSRLDRRVALKVIADEGASPEARARLLREARAAAALDHPNAVSIFDVGELNGDPYVVMELVSGHNLREAVGSPSVPMATRVAWLVDVGKALAAAHKKGLVHRDIKPENVMVRDDGVVKVLDFGIARASRSAPDPSGPTQRVALPTLTRDGVSLGTPAYMAPEQIKGNAVDGRADQFAWGVLAYELLTGRLPWRASDPLAAAAAIVSEDPDPGPLARDDVPEHVRLCVLRALAKDPADRFATMDELLRSVAAASSEPAPGDAGPEPASEEASRGERPTVAASGTPAAEHAASQRAERRTGARPPSPLAADGAPAAEPGVTTGRQYSSGEMRQILSRAIERQAEQPGARISFDDLLEAAREVGVGEEVLREASREVRRDQESKLAARSDDEEFAAWRRRKRRGFFRHLAAYVIVNGALLAVGMLTGHPQMAIGAVFWAIGLLFHAMGVLTANRDDWNERQTRKRKRIERRRAREEERRARERHRQEMFDRVIDEGASLLLAGGKRLRDKLERSGRPIPMPPRDAARPPPDDHRGAEPGRKLRIEPSRGRIEGDGVDGAVADGNEEVSAGREGRARAPRH